MRRPKLEISKAEHHDHPNGIAIRFSNNSNIMLFPGYNLDDPSNYASIWNANDAGWYMEEFQNKAFIQQPVDWGKAIRFEDGPEAEFVAIGPANCHGHTHVIFEKSTKTYQLCDVNGKNHTWSSYSRIINVPEPAAVSLPKSFTELQAEGRLQYEVAKATRDGETWVAVRSGDWLTVFSREAKTYGMKVSAEREGWYFGTWRCQKVTD